MKFAKFVQTFFQKYIPIDNFFSWCHIFRILNNNNNKKKRQENLLTRTLTVSCSKAKSAFNKSTLLYSVIHRVILRTWHWNVYAAEPLTPCVKLSPFVTATRLFSATLLSYGEIQRASEISRDAKDWTKLNLLCKCAWSIDYLNDKFHAIASSN